MQSAETGRPQEAQTPIETGTSWPCKVLGLLAVPFGLFMLAGPYFVIAEQAHKRGAPVTWPMSDWLVFLVLAAVMVLMGVVCVCAGLQYLVLRVHVDDRGLHVRCLRWRVYSWKQVRCQNLIPVPQGQEVVYMFVPGCFGPDADMKLPGFKALFWAYFSPHSFAFRCLPADAREAIVEHIHARLPVCRPSVLPDHIEFRTKPWPMGKRVRLDAHGITVRAWTTERRYNWATDIENLHAECLSLSHAYCQNMRLWFVDGATLHFEKVYPAFWSFRKPDKTIITQFFRRCMPGKRPSRAPATVREQ